jgi:hypothetical protein
MTLFISLRYQYLKTSIFIFKGSTNRLPSRKLARARPGEGPCLSTAASTLGGKVRLG